MLHFNFKSRTNSHTQDTKSFFSDYKDLRRRLIEFISKIDSNISLNTDDNLKNLFRTDLAHIFDTLAPTEFDIFRNQLNNEYREFDVINFNYTHLMDKLIDMSDYEREDKKYVQFKDKYYRILKNIHVHGDSSTRPVIGLNDESQINKELLTDETTRTRARLMIKPNMLDALRNNNKEIANDIIMGSNIIYIFGLSLGASDKIWWEKIAEWLGKNTLNKLIIDQFEFDDTSTDAEEYVLSREEQISKFLQFVDKELENKINVEQQIFVVNNREIFNYEKFVSNN